MSEPSRRGTSGSHSVGSRAAAGSTLVRSLCGWRGAGLRGGAVVLVARACAGLLALGTAATVAACGCDEDGPSRSLELSVTWSEPGSGLFAPSTDVTFRERTEHCGPGDAPQRFWRALYFDLGGWSCFEEGPASPALLELLDSSIDLERLVSTRREWCDEDDRIYTLRFRRTSGMEALEWVCRSAAPAEFQALFDLLDELVAEVETACAPAWERPE